MSQVIQHYLLYQSMYAENKLYFRHMHSALIRLRRVKTDIRIGFAIRGLWLFSKKVRKVFFPPLGYFSVYVKCS